MFFWFLAFIIFVILIFNVVGFVISVPGYKGEVSDHFNGRVFINPGKVKAKGLKDIIRWAASRKRESWKELSVISQGKPPDSIFNDGIKITFVNHSTFLIQMAGVNILTDPIWSQRTSPVRFAGPKRVRPPGILFEDLPAIDFVIISHNHYDHLDAPTMKKLILQHNPQVITPLGVGQFIESLGSKRVSDMDWWQTVEMLNGLKISCVPAQHFSGRGTNDRDATLWCGYVITLEGENIYFAGDTGYGGFFKEIRERYGDMKISFIPIGAYLPRWFMSPIHISPEEAVKVHRDVGSQTSIAMHFGTFPLADDGQFQPVAELKKAIENSGIDKASFKIINEGASIVLN
ncbi:MAG: MBL fold metallo-hydrolase [Cytophagales bacterium]|nr:MBL fold metallo-hydrolase [Cytophagales bacterium]